MMFKKAVISILVLCAIIVLGLALVHDLSPTTPVVDTSEMDKGEYAFDIYGSTVKLPLVYQPSITRSRSSEVFAATSAKVLFTVRFIPSEEQTFASQEEAVDVLYNESQSNTSRQGDYIQTSITKELIGNNYFLVMQGYQPSSDGYNTDYITQYMTYYSNGAYIFDFITPWRDSYSRKDFDGIISTVGFK